MRFPIIKILLLILTDITFAIILFIIYSRFHTIDTGIFKAILALVIGFICIRGAVFFFGNWLFFNRRIRIIRSVIAEFKKGRFAHSYNRLKGDNELDQILKELVIVGKHLDNIVTSQKKEIDNFYDLYNSIIFSMSSYFIILGENDRVMFANDGFYKKFQFHQEDVYQKRIEDIFYFVNARLRGGISQVRKTGKSLVLEKTHLVTLNKVSIIADIKISNIFLKGMSQVIIIIDDVTKKLRNDYQISLMSQISESIQKDEEIDRVLFTILTGVTSGTGLGFNRAMLFLVEDGLLAGKMAVGPDSFEEAIDIWSSVSSTNGDARRLGFNELKSGVQLLKDVLSQRYSLNTNNIFTRCLREKEYIYIFDAYNDESLSDDIREFMDVKEFVMIPLVVGNRAIGIISADNKFNNAPIGRDSIELLSIFASQAAMLIESYKNLDVVKNEMEKLENKQDAIVESEKLAAVGRIAAHLAHEIRNPLVTMGGYARRIIQLAQDKAKSGQKIAESAEIILNESERLEKTLSNVMDFTRPAKFIREFNSINDVITDTADLLKNIFQDKKIIIEMELSDELPLVKSDFNQLKQVMINLLQNSIDATPLGGTISIKTECDDRYINIIVTDTGSGISENDPEIIFEPFFSTKVTGVGLGLAIVKKIVKDHNGTIRVANSDNGGTEMSISIPHPR